KRKGAARSARTTLSGLLVGSDPSVRNGVADDEIEGIHLLAVHLHLVVQMRSADQPGGAHLGDHLSSLHPLTGAHQDAGSVSEASAITEAVIDLHGVAVPAASVPGVPHDSVGRGKDGLPDRGGDVDPAVGAADPEDRMVSIG